MKGLWVPAARSMAEASRSSECPATSTSAKPASKPRAEQCRSHWQPRASLTRMTSGSNGAEPTAPAKRASTSCESMYRSDVVFHAEARAQSGHRLQKRRRLMYGVGPEEHPADRDDQQGVDVPDRRPERIDHPAGLHPLEHQERAVKKAPGGERPARAVPEPAQEEDGHQVGIIPHRRAPIAPQREYRGSRETRWRARCASAARNR